MAVLLLAGQIATFAQQSPPATEQDSLQRALAEAGASEVDFLRAIEAHLEKYPKSQQRLELERSMARVAMDLRDAARVVRYGEPVLERDPGNVDLRERVTRFLLADENPERNQRALAHAKKLEEMITGMAPIVPGMRGAGRLAEERNMLRGKALVYQSRATGNLGKLPEAEALARQSFGVYPTAEAAREVARWLERQGKLEQAIDALAEAFALADPAASADDRLKDRERLAEWHKKWKGSEAGLGDRVLAAFDRMRGRTAEYRATLRAIDPNAGLDDPMKYSLAGLDGDRMELGKLLGKVVVFDFWATWCGPCRQQLPLYEQVQERFKDNPNVVFLNLNTDENRAIVKPFLDRNQWKKTVYFEDGLSQLLRVSSIPTTIIIGRDGRIASRMNGFIAERFVDMLSERIESALGDN